MHSDGDLLAITDFLTKLPAVGYAGFEGLVTRLCEAATGQHFRLSGSGQQSGQDARSESGSANRIKVECKRYRTDSSLDGRELTAELTQAIRSDPNLDLWVLAASRPVQDQIAQDLEGQAAENGVEVLMLDVGTDGLPRLPVLMAGHPHVVRDWLSVHQHPEAPALMSALDAVAASPLFQDAAARIVSKLAGTMLGYESAVIRCKTRLLDTLTDERRTKAQFGQRMAIREPGRLVIPRAEIRTELEQFWFSDRNRAVVLGEEGCGKTWVVMDWVAALAEAPGAPLVIAFTAGVETISSADLEELLPRLLKKWVGLQSEAFWIAKLKRWISASREAKPKIVLVCDGLNERAFNWALFLRILEDPAWSGSVTVVLVDRPEHWRSQCSAMFGYREITVGGYNDEELRAALEGSGICLNDIPGSLLPLIRKPRYCALACAHFDEMKRDSDFTEGRLIWLDMRHRRRDHLGFPMSEDECIAVIQGIARRYRDDDRIFDLGAVQSLRPCPDPDGRVYREILDGLLERRSGTSPKFSARQSHLVYGLGMLIADEIRRSTESQPSSEEIADRIERWFEPHPAMDLKVRICESALFHAFIDPDYPPLARAEFLRYWLHLQNATYAAQETFVGYITRAPEEFIRVAESLFSGPSDLGRAESFFIDSFCTFRDHASVSPAIVAAVSRWMQQTDVLGDSARSADEQRKEKARQSVVEKIGTNRLGPFMVGGFRVTLGEEGSIGRLIGLAFKVISAGSRASFAEALTCWAIGTAINDSSNFSKEFEWLVRLSEDDIASPLIACAAKLLDSGSAVGLEAGHTILRAIGTEEAGALITGHPLPESDSQRQFRMEREANSCHPWFAWSDEDCSKCMERTDIHVDHIVQRLGSRAFDPAFTVSPSLVERAAECFATIPTSLRSGRSTTRDDHNFDSLAPFLAAHKPRALANLVRSVIRTMPDRPIDAQNSLCFWLPRKGPLLHQSEIEAIGLALERLYTDPAQWPPIGRGTVQPGQWIECYSLMGVIPHLNDAQLLRWTLRRPENAYDELRHTFLIRPLLPETVQEVLARVREDLTPNVLGRLLRLLHRSEVLLSDGDRERIVQLAGSDNWCVRACCYRFAAEIGDQALRNQLLALNRYFGESSWLEECAGSEFIVACAEDLTIEDAARRVHPVVLLNILLARGNRSNEVRFCANLLERLIGEVMAAESPESTGIPRIEVSPQPRPLGIEMPEFNEPAISVAEENNDETAALREFFASLTEAHADAALKKKNQENWARVDAVLAGWKTSALKWFGRSFTGPTLGGFYDHAPELVQKWFELGTGNDAKGSAARVRLGTFFAGLAWMLMDRSPKRGCELWQVLFDERNRRSIEVSTEYPFVAQDSPDVNELRWSILRDCLNDGELAEVVSFCEKHGRLSWLRSVIEELILDPRLLQRAKGLTLASLASFSENEFDLWADRARVRDTWVSEQISSLRRGIRSNAVAQHWYRRFLSSNDPDEWWSAFQLVMKCGDERFWAWRSQVQSQTIAAALDAKTAFLEVNGKDIDNELNREAARKKTFCGMDVERVEIFPFFRG